MNKICTFFLLTCCLVSTAFAADSFVIKSIQFNGLQRISEQTAESYLPVKEGDVYTTQTANNIIKALYATGFFTDISLARDGNKLIINVDERPVITTVTVLGNKDIDKDKLNDALKNLGMAQGQVFNSSTFSQVQEALAEQYYSMGRYNAKVTGEVQNLSRNRVAITINVSEGRIAKVMNITIVGNKAFDSSTLLDQLQLSRPTLWSFFTGSDQYSKDKLNKSLDSLQAYYLDHGYINIKIDSSEVTITPDRQYVYIVIHVTEGPQYTFSGYKLTGQFTVPESQLAALVQMKSGDVFSRQAVLNTNTAISSYLGNFGYAFAKVNVTPSVDEQKRTVFITFNVDPGNKYYVRNINFIGNTNTSDIALRNYFTQFEGGLYSANMINQSQRNLRQQTYLKPDQMSVTPTPVPGTDDKVDLAVKVAEQLSAQLSFNIGYSQAYGFLIGAGFTQNNFLGTGRTVGVNFSRSAFQSVYSLSYMNPFFTPDGISHSVQLYYQDTTPGNVGIASYATSVLGYNESLGFPISNYQSFSLGYGLQHEQLLLGTSPSTQTQGFVNQYGSVFNSILANTGWNYNTYDRAQFPTSGDNQSINVSVSLPIGGDSLNYYTASYQNHFYQPLGSTGFIFTPFVALGYGGGYGRFTSLPFFENYFEGGLGTFAQNRAYAPNTLGPLDSNGQPIGGNALVDANLGLIIPTPLMRYNIRTSVFFDAGNVYNLYYGGGPKAAINFNTMQYSYGTQVQWWTPIGFPLIFSLGLPAGSIGTAQTQFFQFSIGGSF